MRSNLLKYTHPTGHSCALVNPLVTVHADPDLCSGGTIRKLGEAAGQLAAAASTGYLVNRTVQNLNQDQESYVTPDTGPAGPTVHADPLPVTSSASTGFPLADGGPQTSISPSTGENNDTLNVLADPLPESPTIGDSIYTSISQQLQQQGQLVTGDFPRTAGPNSLLYRADRAGKITNYQSIIDPLSRQTVFCDSERLRCCP